MSVIKEKIGLYTDFYELAMAEGFFYCGKKDQRVTFNYFFRTPVLCNGSPTFIFSFQAVEFAFELDLVFWFLLCLILVICSAVVGFP